MSNIVTKNGYKFKIMSVDDFIISIDRLTRLKSPFIKYQRVFKDIISKHLLNPSITKKQIEDMSNEDISKIVELIWNESINLNFPNHKKTKLMTNIFKKLDSLVFSVKDKHTLGLMRSKLIITPVIEHCASKPDIPQNIMQLVCVLNEYKEEEPLADFLKNKREEQEIMYPISKIVLAEGITEEILLPVFAKKMNYSFAKHGVKVIGAGGKSKVLNLYPQLKNTIKIPIVILLDSDACQISEQIKKLISKKDKVILIQKGEFEDIVSTNLIKRSFNNNFYDIEKVTISELCSSKKMCDNIKNIYKTRKIGEFQKAHFAKILASTVKYENDISNEIKEIINEIIST